ncbi:MAG: LysR family transcriptional regulator [Firmicutes bacterium]|nr:LysR family transcriptional regulator [Bacillota bacterium]
MYLEQLKHFITVAQLGSVTRAAEQLHVSQPAVSYSLKTLEEELGVSLFRRVKKRLTLTEEGAYYFTHVSSILSQLETINGEMQNLGTKKRSLRIGVPPMIGTFLFPQIFSTVQTHADDMTFEPVEGGSFELQAEIEQETIDMAIVSIPHDTVPTSPSLSYHKLSAVELVYCVSNDHPLAGRDTVDMAELKNETLILYRGGYAHTERLEAAFQKARISPNVIFRTNQFQTILSFVRRNLASSFFYYDAIRDTPGISILHLSEPILLDLHIIWKNNRPLFREAKQFLKLLQDYTYSTED